MSQRIHHKMAIVKTSHFDGFKGSILEMLDVKVPTLQVLDQ
jgi:hypothetical protein